jgi:GxxExxY protein
MTTKARGHEEKHEEEVNIMLKVSSPLSEEQEALVTDTIGCCIRVHRALGPGLLETIYSRAVAIELRAAGIRFDREQRYPVRYRGELLCDQRLDFVIAGTLVLEIKSIEAIAPIHHSQLLSYLRVSKLRIGLLMNFNVAVLKDGLVRKVL